MGIIILIFTIFVGVATVLASTAFECFLIFLILLAFYREEFDELIERIIK